LVNKQFKATSHCRTEFRKVKSLQFTRMWTLGSIAASQSQHGERMDRLAIGDRDWGDFKTKIINVLV